LKKYWLVAELGVIAFGAPFVFFGILELLDKDPGWLEAGVTPLAFGCAFMAWAAAHIAHRRRLRLEVRASSSSASRFRVS